MRVAGLPSVVEGGPELRELVTSFIVLGVPADPGAAAECLGVRREQLAVVQNNGLEAEIDVPAGVWRIWPDRGVALWIARRRDAIPSVPFRRSEIDLLQGISLLVRDGLWPSELRVLADEQWTPRLQARNAVALMTNTPVEAVYGLWSDEEGRSQYAALYQSGEVRAQTEALAERLSIVLGGLSYA